MKQINRVYRLERKIIESEDDEANVRKNEENVGELYKVTNWRAVNDSDK